MPPNHDRPHGKASAVMVYYDTLLTRAVKNLPESSPAARAALYESTRTALISQMKASKRHLSVEAEADVLDEAIRRFEARYQEDVAADVPDTTAVAQGPAESNSTGDGWPSDLSTHTTSNEAPKIKTSSKAALPLRAPASTRSKTSVGVTSTAFRQLARQSASLGTLRSNERYAVPATAPTIPSPRDVKEKPMSRIDELNRALRKLQHDSPGVEASALISEDGLMIASALSQDMEESRVAGMTATLLNLGSRAAIELSRGTVREVIVRGEHGYAVLVSAGRGALLLALTDESAKLGLVFFDMREAVRALTKVL